MSRFIDYAISHARLTLATLFFLLIAFVFWITSLHDKPDFEQTKTS